MNEYLIAYAGALVVLLAMDAVWLGLVMRGFYRTGLGALMRENPRLAAAGVFYAVYVVGIVVFAIGPALDGGGRGRALVMGGLFGFFAYFTYDMVNYATLKGYSLRLVLVDTAWGVVVTGIAALAGHQAAQWFAR